uniref:Uncharacterized protein n=1 Tax=Parastrongyloides trichosuri TaxID=131310 RepID=A0A0N4ZNX3_PARTI
MSSEEDGELLMANVPPFLHPFVSDSNILSHSEELKKQNIGNGLYKYTFSLELQIGIDNSGKIINHSKEQSSKDKEEVLDINCPCKKWNLKNSPRKSKKELSNVIESKNAEERSVPVICYGIKYNKESQLFVPSTHSFCFPRTYTLSKVLDVFFKDSK